MEFPSFVTTCEKPAALCTYDSYVLVAYLDIKKRKDGLRMCSSQAVFPFSNLLFGQKINFFGFRLK